MAFNTEEANINRTKAISDPEVQDRIKKTNMENHGGVLAWHTEESRRLVHEINSRNGNGDACYFFRSPEVRARATNSRWINAFITTCENILSAGHDELSYELYFKYKHSHAPIDVKSFINSTNDERILDILTKFKIVTIN